MTDLTLTGRFLFVAVVLGAACGVERSEPRLPPPPRSDAHLVHTTEVTSPLFEVTQKYRSMEGPMRRQKVTLAESTPPELLWITGYRGRVVAADAEQDDTSQELMCHNNLDFDVLQHRKHFPWARHTSTRMFTLSQGQFAVPLPEGFGIPVLSDTAFQLSSQVLNHNIEHPSLRVRHRVDIDYIRDSELAQPLEPLYQAHVFVMASVEDTEVYYGVSEPQEVHEGASCAPGSVPGFAADHNFIYTDQFGRRFTGHWVLKPGREVRHTLVTAQLGLAFDTRIHFIGVHLHPFAESLQLRDLTTGREVWTARARGPEEGIGLADVDYYADPEGLPLYKDHEYELKAAYKNTSGIDQDAMATMFLYLHNPNSERGIERIRRRGRSNDG